MAVTHNSDPLVIANMLKLSNCIMDQNNVLATILSDLECIKSTVSEIVCDHLRQRDTLSTAAFPALQPQHAGSNSNRYADNNSRRPLKQRPLGEGLNSDAPWTEVIKRKNQRARREEQLLASDKSKGAIPKTRAIGGGGDTDGDSSSESGTLPQGGIQNIPAETDPFINAVRLAERSVLIHNLDLGQTPTINPSTISKKVTAAIVMCITRVSDADAIYPSIAAKEIASDLMGMVRHMDLFGSTTRPVRNASNPSMNGKYYTVPVKLTYQNKQTATRVSELLKGTYKIHTSTPYHKSLRTAISLVHQRVRQNLPSTQVKVSLDVTNKRLKVAVRPDNNLPNNRWASHSSSYPLPQEALDPKHTELSSITLPLTPTRPTADAEPTDGMTIDDDFFSPPPSPKNDGTRGGAGFVSPPRNAPFVPIATVTKRTPVLTRQKKKSVG